MSSSVTVGRSATVRTCRAHRRATKILELACSYGITTSDFDDDRPGHPPAPSDTYHH